MSEGDPSRALLERFGDVLPSANRFAALARDSEKTALVPRQSDPAIRKLLDHVLDSSRLEAAERYGLKDIAILDAWSRAAGRIGNVYLRAGATSAVDPNEPISIADRNVVQFAPEVGRSVDALLRLQTLTADVITITLAKEPNEESPAHLALKLNLIETSSRLSTLIKTTLCFLVIEDLPQGWARERIEILAEIAPRAMRHVEAADADLIRTFVEGATGGLQDSTAKTELEAISVFRRA